MHTVSGNLNRSAVLHNKTGKPPVRHLIQGMPFPFILVNTFGRNTIFPLNNKKLVALKTQAVNP
jgi:hypothetical protein